MQPLKGEKSVAISRLRRAVSLPKRFLKGKFFGNRAGKFPNFPRISMQSISPLPTYGLINDWINTGGDGALSRGLADRFLGSIFAARRWHGVGELGARDGQVQKSSLDVVVFAVGPVRWAVNAAALEVLLDGVDDLSARFNGLVLVVDRVLEVRLDESLELVAVLI